MPVKKRKLSPSSSTSATPGQTPTPTPAPASTGLDSWGLKGHPASPSSSSANLDNGSAPPEGSGSWVAPRSGLGATPAPAATHACHQGVRAKHGVIQPGSGDGQDCGDECFLWNDLPMNKHGFRYVACAPSPIFSADAQMPFYRNLPPPPPCPPVHLSWTDRSPFLRLSADASTCTTDRGFRAGRANLAVREGRWYFECHILRGHGGTGGGGGTGGDVGNAHVRVGWGRREALMDAPVGADGYSYAIRDVDGAKVHISRPKPYAGTGFGTGDVVGCMITLPYRPAGEKEAISELYRRKRVPIRYKHQHYFEMDDYAPAKEMEALVDREGKVAAAKRAAAAEAETPVVPKGKKTKNAKAVKSAPTVAEPIMRDLPVLQGSSIEFFINGVPASDVPAFSDLYDFPPLPPIIQNPPKQGRASHANDLKQVDDDGTMGYYPMVSCFGRGKAKLVCGPDFAFPPPGLRVSGGPPGESVPGSPNAAEDTAYSSRQPAVRPMSERLAEFRAEEAILDEAEELDLSARFAADAEATRARQERADKALAASAAKKAARAEARIKARVSETPVPMVPSGLAHEVKPDPDEEDVGRDGFGEGESGSGVTHAAGNSGGIRPDTEADGVADAEGEMEADDVGAAYSIKVEAQSQPPTTPASPNPIQTSDSNRSTPLSMNDKSAKGRSVSARSQSIGINGSRGGSGTPSSRDMTPAGLGNEASEKDADGEEEGVQWD